MKTKGDHYSQKGKKSSLKKLSFLEDDSIDEKEF